MSVPVTFPDVMNDKLEGRTSNLHFHKASIGFDTHKFENSVSTFQTEEMGRNIAKPE